jgi:hypothetical protein
MIVQLVFYHWEIQKLFSFPKSSFVGGSYALYVFEPVDVLSIVSTTLNSTSNSISLDTVQSLLVQNSSFAYNDQCISETSVQNLMLISNNFTFCGSSNINIPTPNTFFYAGNSFVACPPPPTPTLSPTLPPSTSFLTPSLQSLSCAANNGGCDYRVLCYSTNGNTTCGLCPLDTIASSNNSCTSKWVLVVVGEIMFSQAFFILILCRDGICNTSLREDCVTCLFDCNATTCGNFSLFIFFFL